MNNRAGKISIGIIFLIFLCLFNVTKKPDSDWANYIDQYIKIKQVGYINFLKYGGLSVRPTEPLYYAMAYILSLISDVKILLFALLFHLQYTLFIYMHLKDL
jgi:hypothetical protein